MIPDLNILSTSLICSLYQINTHKEEKWKAEEERKDMATGMPSSKE